MRELDELWSRSCRDSCALITRSCCFCLSPFWALPLTYNGLSVTPSLLPCCITPQIPDSFCGEFSRRGAVSVSSPCLPRPLGGKSFPLWISHGSGAALSEPRAALGSWSWHHTLWDGDRWREGAAPICCGLSAADPLLCGVSRRELRPCGLPAAGC